MLNEPQATLLMTFMRNKPKVIEFKVRLGKGSFRMRDQLGRREQSLWRQMQELIAREVESKVRASFGSHLILERKREISRFDEEGYGIESQIQPPSSLTAPVTRRVSTSAAVVDIQSLCEEACMVRFVTIQKFCELTGYKPAAVYTKKCKGIWPEGSVWRYEPGTRKILMDIAAFEEWVEAGDRSFRQVRPGAPMRSPTRPNLDGNGSTSTPRRLSPLRPALEPPKPRTQRRLRGDTP